MRNSKPERKEGPDRHETLVFLLKSGIMKTVVSLLREKDALPEKDEYSDFCNRTRIPEE